MQKTAWSVFKATRSERPEGKRDFDKILQHSEETVNKEVIDQALMGVVPQINTSQTIYLVVEGTHEDGLLEQAVILSDCFPHFTQLARHWGLNLRTRGTWSVHLTAFFFTRSRWPITEPWDHELTLHGPSSVMNQEIDETWLESKASMGLVFCGLVFNRDSFSGVPENIQEAQWSRLIQSDAGRIHEDLLRRCYVEDDSGISGVRGRSLKFVPSALRRWPNPESVEVRTFLECDFPALKTALQAGSTFPTKSIMHLDFELVQEACKRRAAGVHLCCLARSFAEFSSAEAHDVSVAAASPDQLDVMFFEPEGTQRARKIRALRGHVSRDETGQYEEVKTRWDQFKPQSFEEYQGRVINQEQAKYLESFANTFCKMITKSIHDCARHKWSCSDQLGVEVLEHLHRAQDLWSPFFGRERLLKKLVTFEPGKVLVVLGPHGSGKSALMAQALRLVQPEMHGQTDLVSALPETERRQWNVILRFIGLKSKSESLASLLRSVSLQLLRNAGRESSAVSWDESELCTMFPWCLGAHSTASLETRTNLVLLDGVDRLTTAGRSQSRLGWVPRPMPSNTRFIISLTDRTHSSEVEFVTSTREFEVLRLNTIELEDIVPMLSSWLQLSGRKLSGVRLQKTAAEIRKMPQILVVHLLVNNLFPNWESVGGPPPQGLPSSLREVIASVLLRVQREFPPGLVGPVVCFLVLSNGGLLEYELLDLLSLDSMAVHAAYSFSRVDAPSDVHRFPTRLLRLILGALQCFFDDGRDFGLIRDTHSNLVDALKRTWKAEFDNIHRFCGRSASYFSDEVPLGQSSRARIVPQPLILSSGSVNRRVLAQLPHAFKQLQDWDSLSQWVSSSCVTNAFMEADLVADLLQVWTLLPTHFSMLELLQQTYTRLEVRSATGPEEHAEFERFREHYGRVLFLGSRSMSNAERKECLCAEAFQILESCQKIAFIPSRAADLSRLHLELEPENPAGALNFFSTVPPQEMSTNLQSSIANVMDKIFLFYKLQDSSHEMRLLCDAFRGSAQANVELEQVCNLALPKLEDPIPEAEELQTALAQAADFVSSHWADIRLIVRWEARVFSGLIQTANVATAADRLDALRSRVREHSDQKSAMLIWTLVGRVASKLHLFPEATYAMERQLELQSKVVDFTGLEDLDKETKMRLGGMQSRRALKDLYMRSQRHDEAVALQKSTIRVLQQLFPRGTPELIETQVDLARTCFRQEHYEDAAHFVDQAIDLVRARGPIKMDELAEWHLLSGCARVELRDYSRARQEFRSALSLRDEVFGQGSLQSMECLRHVSDVESILITLRTCSFSRCDQSESFPGQFFCCPGCRVLFFCSRKCQQKAGRTDQHFLQCPEARFL